MRGKTRGPWFRSSSRRSHIEDEYRRGGLFLSQGAPPEPDPIEVAAPIVLSRIEVYAEGCEEPVSVIYCNHHIRPGDGIMFRFTFPERTDS